MRAGHAPSDAARAHTLLNVCDFGDGMEHRSIASRALRALFFLLLLNAPALSVALAAPAAQPASAAPPATGAEAATSRAAADDGWVVMPAGARPAYMGIHGGTMPVSLLVAGDGTSLFTFVGRTGNDFLEALRATDVPLPGLLNATAPSAGAALFAGNATSSLPVIPLDDAAFATLAAEPGTLRPFGLSDAPLTIEGRAERPAAPTPAKTYRLFVLPRYLRPAGK